MEVDDWWGLWDEERKWVSFVGGVYGKGLGWLEIKMEGSNGDMGDE
ncbi:hypothetical protein [Siminovitchia fortis]|nr:hypothetical protein [Siminovitchia fortis]